MLRSSWRALLAHKGRLILSTLAIVLGVALVAGSLVFTDTLKRTFTDIIEGSAQDVQVLGRAAFDADLTSYGGDEEPLPIPDELVPQVRALPGVEAAEGSVFRQGVYLLDAAGAVVGATTGAPGMGMNWTETASIAVVTLTSGSAPRGPDDVVVDDVTFDQAGVPLGGTLTAVTPAGSLDFTLTGTFSYGETGGLAGATLAAFTTARAQELLGRPGTWTSIDVAVAPDATDDQVAAEVRDLLGPRFDVRTRAQQVETGSAALQEGLAFIDYFLIGFAAVALVVGAFLIFNTFSMLVARRSREMALLRAVGATRRQVLVAVLLEAAGLGLVGGLLGLLLGFATAAGLKALFGAFGLSMTSALAYSVRAVVVALLLGVVVTVVSAWVPARRASRVPPVAALRDAVSVPDQMSHRRLWAGVGVLAVAVLAVVLGLWVVPARVQTVALAALLLVAAGVVLAPPLAVVAMRGLGHLVPRFGGLPRRLATSNAVRNPRRTAATASALMIGLALVVGITVITASTRTSLASFVDRAVGADLQVRTPTRQPFSRDLAEAVAQVPGVRSVVRESAGVAQVDGRREGITAIGGPVTDAYDVRVDSGDVDSLGRGEALVDADTAQQHGWAVGTEVLLRFMSGAEVTVRIGGVVEPGGALAGLVVPLDTYRAAGGAAQDTMLLVRLDEGADPAVVGPEVKAAVAANPLVVVADRSEVKERQAAGLDQLLFVVYALLALSLVIAVLGIVNTLALSVAERVREIGLLRAVGATRAQVRAMVRWESVGISVFGGVLGVVIGVAVGVILQRALVDSGITDLTVPVLPLLAFLVVAGLAGVLAGALPAAPGRPGGRAAGGDDGVTRWMPSGARPGPGLA